MASVHYLGENATKCATVGLPSDLGIRGECRGSPLTSHLQTASIDLSLRNCRMRFRRDEVSDFFPGKKVGKLNPCLSWLFNNQSDGLWVCDTGKTIKYFEITRISRGVTMI